MTLLFYTFCALILCISITSSIKINEIMSNIAIGSCNAVDILRYNDIFQRFADLQSLASKGRLNGPNPDSVAVQNFNDFMEETTVSDFRFEIYYTDRNKASTPVGPVVYTSRDAYLYGDQDLEIPVLSWIASTDTIYGTINLNGGQFGYVNCEYNATNTATLFSRTVDFVTGERGEYDAMGRTLGNLDQNENGRIDNTLGLCRFETTFNAYKIAAIKVESEVYGTIEVNSFQETAFPASKPIVLKPNGPPPRLTANDRFEIQDILINLLYFRDQLCIDNLNGADDIDDKIDDYINVYVANHLHDDFVLIVNGVPQNKEETLASFSDLNTYTISHHVVQPFGFLSYDVSKEKDSQGMKHVIEDVVVSYSSQIYRAKNYETPTLIMRTGQRKFRRTDGAQFMNIGGSVTANMYQTNIVKQTLIFGYRFGLLIVINIICICFLMYWFNNRADKRSNKYKVVDVSDQNL